MPLVSICIPTYNHGQFLGESLRSAIAQTYSDIEIVVLDNASQDDTESIVAAAAARDPRVHYIKHPRNIGLVGNLNACIQCARGAYVKILCADDSLEPTCISAMIKVFLERPEVSLVGCARIVTDVNLRVLRTSRVRSHFAVIPGDYMLAECFFFGNRIGEPTAVMFRRADSLRGFSERYHALVDLEMWFQLLGKGYFAAIPDALCRFRTHAGQATNALEQSGHTVEDRLMLFGDFAPRAAQAGGPLRKFIWDFRLAYLVARAGRDFDEARVNARSGTFFPRAFSLITYPMVKIMITFGFKRVWRTA